MQSGDQRDDDRRGISEAQGLSGSCLPSESNNKLPEVADPHVINHSDSVLSRDDDDDCADDELSYRSHVRKSSVKYIEDASIEAALLPLATHRSVSGDSTKTSGTNISLRIEASGPMGRRHPSISESDLIFLGEGDLERTETTEMDVDSISSAEHLRLPDGIGISDAGIPEQSNLKPHRQPEPSPVRNKEIPSIAKNRSAREVLEAYGILSSRDNEKIVDDGADSEPALLHSLFDGLCSEPVDRVFVEKILLLEKDKDYRAARDIPLPVDAPVACRTKRCRPSSLLQQGLETKPVLLQLPVPFGLAFLRILVRLLSLENDSEYNEACFYTEPWAEEIDRIDVSGAPPTDPDHPTRRPHLLYNVARFQCRSRWFEGSEDEYPGVRGILLLWEKVAERKDSTLFLPPLARLLGILSVAGTTPRVLRRMISLTQNPALSLPGRLSMVRALRTAGIGSSRSSVLPKLPPKDFFLFNGKGLCRTITGLSAWPFRNDFGLALWFRVESFVGGSSPVLFSARLDDGGGVEVSLAPLEGQLSEACTVVVSIYDNGAQEKPTHQIRVQTCVLLRRVWYHLAVRHTRSRMKGVFSLSTRQHLSIMIDGKTILSESLPFPRVSEGELRSDKSVVHPQLLRSSSRSRVNVELRFGNGFDGETGGLYVFSENISDASLRALYEATGGNPGASLRLKRSDSAWDSRRSDIVRKSRVLDANLKEDDADDIVLSQRKLTGTRSTLEGRFISVLDLTEQDDEDLIPVELQKLAFGSKIFLCWAPRRTFGPFAVEVHIGAHLTTSGVFQWKSSSAQDTVSSTGGVQVLVPMLRSFISNDKDRILAFGNKVGLETVVLIRRTIPDLLFSMAAFLHDNNDNAREMLRCGGMDVVEQLLLLGKRSVVGKNGKTVYGFVASHQGAALYLASSLLLLRKACAHYAGLETKVFSRLIFNIPLWNYSPNTDSPSLSHLMLLILSSLTRQNPDKVRDCVGVKDMVHELGKSDTGVTVGILLGMIFDTLATGVGASPSDVASFVSYLSFLVTKSKSNVSGMAEQACKHLIRQGATLLLFLVQIRPRVPGLIESLAVACNGMQGIVAWLLCSFVNTTDDQIRSIGIRCVSAFLDLTSGEPDAPVSFGAGALASDSEMLGGDSLASLRSANRIGMIAKGIVSIGPGFRGVIPSKLTARVCYKLLWHLLKKHRFELGPYSHAALLSLVTDDNGIVSSSIASLDFVRYHLLVPHNEWKQGYHFEIKWAEAIWNQTNTIIGKSLRNPLGIGTLLRLLRYFEPQGKAVWLTHLLTLVRSSRKCVNLLSSITDWQPCLFQLISEILESVSCLPFSGDRGTNDGNLEEEQEKKSETESEDLQNILDQALELYATLVGSLVREGGEKALNALEEAASLQRVCLNGQTVFLLILSSLCANLFDHGTLLAIGSITAQDWQQVNLDQESLVLKQNAKLVTDAILSNGTKDLDLNTAVRCWQSLRHLTEVVVALVTRCGFGVVDLFDYANQLGASVDTVSGGLNGIRLPESRLLRIHARDYVRYVSIASKTKTKLLMGESDDRLYRDVDARLCTALAAQVFSLLDPFIFPEALDESMSVSHAHSMALVQNSEPRLGISQGPLVLSAVRLSFLLLAVLEPCSVQFLQCASRLRCLLSWTLEIIRDFDNGLSTVQSQHRLSFDNQIVAIVLHCHRALSRCTALLSEIDSSTYEKYFSSRETQKKYLRRLLRGALELRDVVSMAYRGRNSILRSVLSLEAFESLRASLEGSALPAKSPSKESLIREFLSSSWVSTFQDTEIRVDLAVPEQLCMDSIPLSSDNEHSSWRNGFAVVEDLAQDATRIQVEFEKAIDSCFESYLDAQRLWAETDAVRDLEYEGDTILSRLTDRFGTLSNESARLSLARKAFAEGRWRTIQQKVSAPWKLSQHWRLAPYTDRLGRRTLLVPNLSFESHEDASYEKMSNQKDIQSFERRMLEKEELSNVMRRNAEAFEATSFDIQDDDSSDFQASDTESITDAESDTDSVAKGLVDTKLPSVEVDNTADNDDGWDKIDSAELKDVDRDGDSDGWAKSFIWSDSESVIARFEPVMVVSLQTFVEGKILLTTHGLYFHQTGPEVNIMTKESIENKENSSKDRRWRLSRLTEVHGRRYMLRPQALELFFADSHELFLNFSAGGKERDRFYAKLRNSAKVPMLWSLKSLNPRTVFRRSKLTELWRKRKISNYEYLMALNRMAGRSFNDITQYPVFPWILSDYTSESIDLKDSRYFRDLSKPIGALNPDRLSQLLERYNDLDLIGFSETEKFLYGSHYASPGIVLHYLVRQEPFTSMAINLQSGRFDCPDRLFFDLEGSWNSCMVSTSDMKELIPEFFNLPEMFINTNHFPLGHTQSGRSIDNVGLPPWAKGSAHEFVRVHRLALESDFVSQNLHHWIDLIFGYKQRGPEAEAAHNIFHHLSYEGSVDLDKIADDVDRLAAETHIQNFGQTPSQLTIDIHPGRYAAEDSWKPLLHDLSAVNMLQSYSPLKQFCNKRVEHANGAVTKIHVLSDKVIALYGDMSIGSYRWYPGTKANRLRMDSLRPVSGRELSRSRSAIKRGSAIPIDAMTGEVCTGPQCFALTLGGLAKEVLRRNARLPSSRILASAEITVASAESSAMLVSCDFWDDTVKVHRSDGGTILCSDNGGHRGRISCLAVSDDSSLMVTGGYDCTTRVWVVAHRDMAIALSDGYVQTALGASNDGEQLISCCHVLWGHDTPVTCVDLDSDLDVVVSGSKSGAICVHTLRVGEFVRSFKPPSRGDEPEKFGISLVRLHSSGSVVIFTTDCMLHSFTLNGFRLASVQTEEHLNDMMICSMGEFLVTGGALGYLIVRSVSTLAILSRIDLSKHGSITCIAMTPQDLNPIPQTLFVGSDDGMLSVVERDLSPPSAT